MDDEHLGDDVIELVLGTADGDRRARLAAHVLRCAACRREYDELAATVQDLLPAGPAVQPPLGFDERVLDRLAADGADDSNDSNGVGVSGAGWRRWRWIAAAAAVVVALLVPLGVWLASRSESAPAAGVVATLHRTKDGTSVGTVSVSEVGGKAVMVVAITDAPPDVSYYCRIAFADGTTVDSESWPAGNGAWIVPLAGQPHDVTSVALLPHGTEKVWSEATLT
jgi:anti-sigma-K factor RskA